MKKINKLFIAAIAGIISLNGYANDVFVKPDYGNFTSSSFKKSRIKRRSNELSIGGGTFFHIYGGGTGLKILGLNLLGEYGTEKLAYRGSFNYGFPKTTSYETSGFALSSTTVPSYSTATAKNKITIMSLAFDVKKIFGRNSDYSDGGIYGFIGAGLSIATAKTTLEGNSPDYQYDTSDGKESFTQFLIRAGIGYDVRLDFGTIFGEGILNIPANQVNGQSVEIQIPISFGLQAGIRIPLGR